MLDEGYEQQLANSTNCEELLLLQSLRGKTKDKTAGCLESRNTARGEDRSRLNLVGMRSR
jgi:hypothetical protein